MGLKNSPDLCLMFCRNLKRSRIQHPRWRHLSPNVPRGSHILLPSLWIRSSLSNHSGLLIWFLCSMWLFVSLQHLESSFYCVPSSYTVKTLASWPMPLTQSNSTAQACARPWGLFLGTTKKGARKQASRCVCRKQERASERGSWHQKHQALSWEDSVDVFIAKLY